MATALAWIVLVVPLISGVVLAGWPTEPPHAITRLLGIGSILVSFALTLAVFIGVNLAAERHPAARDAWWRPRTRIAALRRDIALLLQLPPKEVGMIILLYTFAIFRPSATAASKNGDGRMRVLGWNENIRSSFAQGRVRTGTIKPLPDRVQPIRAGA